MVWLTDGGSTGTAVARDAVPAHVVNEVLTVLRDRLRGSGVPTTPQAIGAIDTFVTPPGGWPSPESFAAATERHIQAAAGDKHLRVSYNPAHFAFLDGRPFTAPDGRTYGQQNFPDAWLAAYECTNYGVVEAAWVAPGIGRLRLVSFGFPPEAERRIEMAAGLLASARFLVLDLRGCRGGFMEVGLRLLAWLLGDGRPVYLAGNVDGEEQLSTPVTADGPPCPETVVVLCDQSGFSTVEAVAFALQCLHPDAVVVGTCTQGGANAGHDVALVHGYTAFVPAATLQLIDGRTWEGVGVRPDVECRPGDELDRAVALLRERLATGGSQTPAQRRTAVWWKHYLAADPATLVPDTAPFVGHYADRTIYVHEDGRLWHRVRTWMEPLRVDRRSRLLGTFKMMEYLVYERRDGHVVVTSAGPGTVMTCVPDRTAEAVRIGVPRTTHLLQGAPTRGAGDPRPPRRGSPGFTLNPGGQE